MDYSHIGKLYGFLHRKTQLYIREAFKDLNIAFSETIVLVSVFQNPGSSQEEIAEDLSIDKAAVARRVKRLEERGLLYRVPDKEEHRIKRVHATELGLLYRERIDSAMLHWNKATMEFMTEEEVKGFYQTLQRIRDYSVNLKVDEVYRSFRKNLPNGQ